MPKPEHYVAGCALNGIYSGPTKEASSAHVRQVGRAAQPGRSSAVASPAEARPLLAFPHVVMSKRKTHVPAAVSSDPAARSHPVEPIHMRGGYEADTLWPTATAPQTLTCNRETKRCNRSDLKVVSCTTQQVGQLWSERPHRWLHYPLQMAGILFT